MYFFGMNETLKKWATLVCVLKAAAEIIICSCTIVHICMTLAKCICEIPCNICMNTKITFKMLTIFLLEMTWRIWGNNPKQQEKKKLF